MKEIKISVNAQQDLLDEKEEITLELDRIERILVAMDVLQDYYAPPAPPPPDCNIQTDLARSKSAAK